MSDILGIISGVLITGAILTALVWGGIATARERRAPIRPLVRPDVETALREIGCYVVHAESAFDLQLTLF